MRVLRAAGWQVMSRPTGYYPPAMTYPVRARADPTAPSGIRRCGDTLWTSAGSSDTFGNCGHQARCPRSPMRCPRFPAIPVRETGSPAIRTEPPDAGGWDTFWGPETGNIRSQPTGTCPSPRRVPGLSPGIPRCGHHDRGWPLRCWVAHPESEWATQHLGGQPLKSRPHQQPAARHRPNQREHPTTTSARLYSGGGTHRRTAVAESLPACRHLPSAGDAGWGVPVGEDVGEAVGAPAVDGGDAAVQGGEAFG
jgi:hypothetical protein